MKKSKLLLHTIAFAIAIGAAFAFNVNHQQIDLYYLDTDGACKKSDCATINQNGRVCNLVTYTDKQCEQEYAGRSYITE
jgi:hypothetical protein